jgi:ATP-dependent helicase/nuclease subunit A
MTGPTATPRPGLNAQQQHVVARLDGDTFVRAGAGSGKTRVLAERFASLVLEGEDTAGDGDALRRVLLLTFTDKAAGELGERVRRVLLERGRPDLARAVDRAWISTIHGFCGRIVRRHAIELGIDPGFSVIVEPQAGVMREQAFEEAAGALVGEPEVAELLEAHGVEAVRRAVIHGLDQVRAMGRLPQSLTVPDAPRCAPVVRALRAGLPETIRAYEELRPLAFVAHNTALLRELPDLLDRLARSPEAEMAREIVAHAPHFRLQRPGNAKGDEREHTLDLGERLDEVVLAAVEAVAAGHASAFKRLMVAYAEAYETRKTILGSLDFEDLQLLAARTFEELPAIARGYAARFRAAMIDEFQDTNELQLRVVEPITRGHLCVVGDENQSIYGFRFADLDVFRGRHEAQLASDAAGACPLQVNYRTHPDLLATLNAMFEREPFFAGGYLRLEAGRSAGWRLALGPETPRTEVLLVDRVGWEDISWREAEARSLARRIASLVAAGVAAQDVVVLLRQMTSAQIYVEALRDEGLEVHAESSGGFFAAREVADVRALLAVLANPRDESALVALLAGGLGGVSDGGMYRLSRSPASSGGLWHALGSPGESGLVPEDEARCVLVRGTIDSLRRELGRRRLADVLLDAVAVLGPGGGALASSHAWPNVRKAARIAAEFERVATADPASFLQHLDEREAFVKRESAVAMAAEGGGAVRVMTVHAAKGLEFPVVAVADLGHESPTDSTTLGVVKTPEGVRVTARVPHSSSESLPTPRDFEAGREASRVRALEEEKRVFYVACTRAEELLILSGAARLEKPPGAQLAIDWVRTVLGSPEAPALPGVTVAVVTAEDGSGRVVLEERHRAVPPARAHSSEGPVRQTAPTLRAADAASPPSPPTELSYTALSLYESCPYRFFAERVLGLGTAAGGDPTGGPRELGLALHAALQLRAAGGEPDEARLDALARYHGLDAAGRSRLGEAVDGFRASPAARALAGRDVQPEVRFVVRLRGGATLVGTLDLVARDSDGALVVDYKTGAAELDAGVARSRYETQAGVYALALLRSGVPSVEVRFVEVERGCRETHFAYTAADADALEEGVAVQFARIASGAYPHLPAFDQEVCGQCPASGNLCPVVRRGTKKRGVRSRAGG